MTLTSLSLGPARFRLGPWQGGADVAYLAPLTRAATLKPSALSAVRSRLRSQGYRAIVTSALGGPERDRLIGDGFRVHSELVALTIELGTGLAPPSRMSRIRRGRRGDVDGVLRVDADAFPPFWRFNADSLHEARTATPVSRWRVSRGPEVEAYSVTGRAGARGYVQRLAVARSGQGQGMGTLLVADALHWLRRGGARTAMVNTQPDNDRALSLYRQCGFRTDPDRLSVLCRDLL